MRSRKGGSPSLLLLRAFDTSPTLSSLLAFCGEEGERGKVFEVKGKRGEGKVKRLGPLSPSFSAGWDTARNREGNKFAAEGARGFLKAGLRFLEEEREGGANFLFLPNSFKSMFSWKALAPFLSRGNADCAKKDFGGEKFSDLSASPPFFPLPVSKPSQRRLWAFPLRRRGEGGIVQPCLRRPAKV